jgi:peptide/nickel transport system substrate-binding protein
VQFLRGFRDNHILSTAAGSGFMNVFNGWYYSFSPQVADYERANPWAQATIKTAIYPLLGILQVAEKGYGMSAGEGGAVVAGFAASTLIGAVYLSPAAVALRNRAPGKKLLVALGISALASLAAVAAGVATANSAVLMVSTALFVLSSIGVGLFAVMATAKRIEEKRRR